MSPFFDVEARVMGYVTLTYDVATEDEARKEAMAAHVSGSDVEDLSILEIESVREVGGQS